MEAASGLVWRYNRDLLAPALGWAWSGDSQSRHGPWGVLSNYPCSHWTSTYYVPANLLCIRPLSKALEAWCHLTVILILRRLRQEDCTVGTSLGYIDHILKEIQRREKRKGGGKERKGRGGTNRHSPHTNELETPDLMFCGHGESHRAHSRPTHRKTWPQYLPQRKGAQSLWWQRP